MTIDLSKCPHPDSECYTKHKKLEKACGYLIASLPCQHPAPDRAGLPVKTSFMLESSDKPNTEDK